MAKKFIITNQQGAKVSEIFTDQQKAQQNFDFASGRTTGDTVLQLQEIDEAGKLGAVIQGGQTQAQRQRAEAEQRGIQFGKTAPAEPSEIPKPVTILDSNLAREKTTKNLSFMEAEQERIKTEREAREARVLKGAEGRADLAGQLRAGLGGITVTPLQEPSVLSPEPPAVEPTPEAPAVAPEVAEAPTAPLEAPEAPTEAIPVEMQVLSAPMGSFTQQDLDKATEIQGANDFADAQTNEVTLKFGQFAQTLNESSQQILQNIQANLEQRREQVKDLNRRTLGVLTSAGFRTGRFRRTPETQAGIMSTAEMQGIRRLTEIDLLEKNAISEAIEARDNRQFALLNEKVETIREIRKDKIAEVQNIERRFNEAEENLRARDREVRAVEKFVQDFNITASKEARESVAFSEKLIMDRSAEVRRNEEFIQKSITFARTEQEAIEEALQKAKEAERAELRFLMEAQRFDREENEAGAEEARRNAREQRAEAENARQEVRLIQDSLRLEQDLQLAELAEGREQRAEIRTEEKFKLDQVRLQQDNVIAVERFLIEQQAEERAEQGFKQAMKDAKSAAERRKLQDEFDRAEEARRNVRFTREGVSFAREGETFEQQKKRFEIEQKGLVNDEIKKLEDRAKLKLSDILDNLTGVDPDTLTNTSRAKIESMANALEIPSEVVFKGLKAEYLKVSLEQSLKRADIQKKVAETKKAQVRPPISLLNDNEKARAIQVALETIKFPSVSAKDDAVKTINELIAQDDFSNAKRILEAQLRNSASATAVAALDGKDATIRALERIRADLAKLKADNIDTGFLTGLKQKGLEKLGRSTDVSAVQNDIALAVIDYRKAVSGAAFTESEGQAYENVFPSSGKVPELNEIKINSLITKMREDKDSFIASRIGDENFNLIFGEKGNVVSEVEAPEFKIENVNKEAIIRAFGSELKEAGEVLVANKNTGKIDKININDFDSVNDEIIATFEELQRQAPTAEEAETPAEGFKGFSPEQVNEAVSKIFGQ
jgi:hypothetical protein